MWAGVAEASDCSRKARNLNFFQGKVSQFLNAAKSFKDLKDAEKNRTIRHRQHTWANPSSQTNVWPIYGGIDTTVELSEDCEKPFH